MGMLKVAPKGNAHRFGSENQVGTFIPVIYVAPFPKHLNPKR